MNKLIKNASKFVTGTLIITCLLELSGATDCRRYVKTTEEKGIKTETISLPLDEGVYRGLFHKPIIYGGMGANNTFYIYQSRDDRKPESFNASSFIIRYDDEKYRLLKVTPDSLILEHVEHQK